MKYIPFLFLACLLCSCSENYSNGERIGLITQFSSSGAFHKSWEGHLNMTQTGMNSSQAFDFSIDNDHEDQVVINAIDSAAQHGWKVKLTYHETIGKNWFSNRGDTDHFITAVEILDKSPLSALLNNRDSSVHGHTIDTIYVVIDKSK
jgi:hypothetical protein